MKIEKAIKLIQADIDDGDVEWDSPLGEAYKLSFEALKEIERARTYSVGLIPNLLPGETKDIKVPS